MKLNMNLLFSRSSSSRLKLFDLKVAPNSALAKANYSQQQHGGTATRGKYALLNEKHLTFFENTLGTSGFSTCEDELAKYNVDWFHTVKGASKLLLRPKSTQEVSEILKYCNQENLAICPLGGNTGVVGGAVPVFDEIVLSTGRMDKIISLDQESGALVCQSGCILDNLNTYLADKNLIIPLDLGAKGSCQIGGNVSTNAGGLRLLRYGNMHGNVLGLEAVLANGTIVDSLTMMRKDNTGYALKNLFIGSEGTLGVVTTVAIQCAQKPNAVNVAFLGVKSYEDVLRVLHMAKKDLSEILSAFEYMDEDAMNAVVDNLKLKPPLDGFPFYLIIETSGSNSAHDEEKLHAFLTRVMEEVKETDGTIGADESQKTALWDLRERMPEALLREGYFYTYDLSIPISTFDELVKDMRQRLGSKVKRCTGFGHLGDGNIHLIITSPKFDPAVLSTVEPYVYEWVQKRKGSISAEHGLGYLKRNYIGYSNSPESIEIMKGLKKYFDPNHILNPYKMFQQK